MSARAPARIGLLGYPGGGGLPADSISGFGGRTVAMTVPRYFAEVSVEEADGIEIVPLAVDRLQWSSVTDLVDDVERRGYSSASSLLTATIKTLADLADSVGHPGIDRLGFRLRYHSTIPPGVGLAESSALVVAALRALTEFINLAVPAPVLATTAHRIATQQLGLVAELDDAVVQAYSAVRGQSVVAAMNFGVEQLDGRFGVGYGDYELLDGSGLPPTYLAYRSEPVAVSVNDSEAGDGGEPDDLYQRLRRSRGSGHGQTREVLRQLATVATEGEAALRWRNGDRFAELLSRDLQLRRMLAPFSATQEALVEAATGCDSMVTVASSLADPLVGASVLGTYRDADHLAEISAALKAAGAEVVAIDAPPDPGSDDERGHTVGRNDDFDPDDPDTVIPFDPTDRLDIPDGAA